MSEPVTPPKTTFVFDFDLCNNHLHQVVASLEQYEGKKGHNPFVYLEQNVKPLITRLGTKEKGERTPELEKAILALSVEKAPKYIDDVPTPVEDKGNQMKKPGFITPPAK